jgi:hypothetical protein
MLPQEFWYLGECGIWVSCLPLRFLGGLLWRLNRWNCTGDCLLLDGLDPLFPLISTFSFKV